MFKSLATNVNRLYHSLRMLNLFDRRRRLAFPMVNVVCRGTSELPGSSKCEQHAVKVPIKSQVEYLWPNVLHAAGKP